MGLFSFLTGKPPEEMELDGDKYIEAKEYGAAKVEFESALAKAEDKFPEKQNLIKRLFEKINQTKEALAVSHIQTAEHLAASENFKEAEDLFQLALELAQNTSLKEKISVILKKLIKGQEADHPDAVDVNGSEPDHFITQDETVNEDEYFSVLCNALPDDVREATALARFPVEAHAAVSKPNSLALLSATDTTLSLNERVG